MALEITTENFKTTVLDSNQVALVDFWAEWCGPCRMVGPIVDELSKEYEGKAIIGKVNVDQQRDIAANYGISSIPTILFIKGGQIVDKQVGAVPKSELKKKLDNWI
ncbi:MAG: thioredoxin [Bacteroidetes bacterium]|jgi:thioredoxin 1|nr:thioredoxin [Bacteroidota bacterium]MBP7256608.1 thioredoxin [Chitinophagales bacterium]MBK7138955.1 thioredoxin [Bacteroidota bacterium]MBK7506416.1 thioredoxin [Bacteroidota bacterium]MBK7640330.1 thioredoxin [Bacteroidota bacterium]